jgi:hypothetical protein
MPPSLFLKIHLNSILPSTPGSSKWSLSLRFPRPSHSRFDHQNYMWWEVQFTKVLIMSLLHVPVTSSLLGPYTQQSILKLLQSTWLPHCERPSSTPIHSASRTFYRCDLSMQMVFVSRLLIVSLSLTLATTGQWCVTVNSQTSSILEWQPLSVKVCSVCCESSHLKSSVWVNVICENIVLLPDNYIRT